MSSPHRIDQFNFEFWEGSEPVRRARLLQSFSRPGVDDFGQQLLGIGGPEFQAVLTSVWASYALALDAVQLYQSLIGRSQPVTVTFNGIDFAKRYQTRYRVSAVEQLETQAHVRLIGPTYNLTGGTRLVTRWTLRPVPA